MIRRHHRGSQAGRLADELTLIASGQASASLALAAAGEQLVAEAVAEKPLPREYTLPSSAPQRARLGDGERLRGSPHNDSNAVQEDGGKISQRDDQGHEISETVAGVLVPAGDPDGERGATSDTCNDEEPGSADGQEANQFRGGGSGLLSASSAVNTTAPTATAIEVAAVKEEVAAAVRIQAVLRLRRGQTRPGDMRQVPVAAGFSSTIESSGHDQRSTDSKAEWFGEALRRLRREVDSFLLGDQRQDPASAVDSTASSLQDIGDRAQEPEQEKDSVALPPSNTDNGSCTDDETADTHISTESSGYDNDEDWPAFPPVPLRARAPSLYTLPAPGSSTWKRAVGVPEVEGGESRAAGISRSTAAAEGEGGIFRKLGPEVVTRLSSARSVFCLRAADVLAAFSPPPPPPRSPSPLGAFAAKPKDTLLGPRPSTVPGQTIGRGNRSDYGGHGKLSSPDALRHRLRREAEDVSRAGFGRPWLLSSHKRRVPTRHRREQEQLSAIIRERNSARSARGKRIMYTSPIEPGQEKQRRLDFFGSWTPLGRRLAKRYCAGLAARRRRVLGETDQFRARHVGRQLRSGAATSALEGVERALDLRLSVRRERKVPPGHVTELLDVVDRYVFSDSQV